MAVKVLFEVGHTSKLKSKQTPDGFTHDWELYVRGTDKNDISHFVDKVVFNLHESFPKPKRVLKESPYVLKESGYAGFLVPTEIHFKARDQPKVTFTYDLQLQNAGPPVHRSEIKKFTFNNPSDEFRRKLLKGGGTSLVNNAADDKSRDSLDDRSQPMSKPKISNEDAAKKHKIRPEESKLQTFAKLFGPPITKTTSKVSPDAKTKSSPSTNVPGTTSKGSKSSEKSSSTSTAAKDKPEKPEKKEKHKHSPHKEKYEVKESKKSDEKHERREEKKKDKSHSKERDRSRDKSSKRPPSPKRAPPSPKRQSPVRSSSAAGRADTNGFKASAKPHADNVSLNNNAEKIPASSSSSGKKSKKEKKSYDKDRDREKGKDKDRDRKDKPSDDRSSNNSTPVVPNVIPANYQNASAAQNNNSKLPSNDVKSGAEFVKSKEKEKELVNSGSSKETAKEPNKKSNVDTSSNLSDVKKPAEKHDKDLEKRHKHKKKDKSKEKEKDHSTKDNKKKEKSTKKDELKKTPVANEAPIPTSQKSNITPLSTLLHGISDDDDSRDSITESVSASVSERHESFAESSNSSVTDNAAKAAVAAANVLHQPPPPPAPAPPPEDPKPDKKERKNREKVKTEKDEKKRKRKSKDDVDASHKATPPPVLIPEPPVKQVKKDELIVKNGDRSNSPHLPHITTNNSVPNPSPKAQLIVDDSKAFRTPNAANVPLPSTSSSSTNSNTSQTSNHPDRSFTVDYISELRDLQQKIMTLQDSNDLQQVVELIAPTGRFEITSKSFDFDLCTLDRITVQKLQDFFATSCS